MTDQQKDGERPLSDVAIWGHPVPAKRVVCPLMEEGKCPAGCRRCTDFKEKMEEQDGIRKVVIDGEG